MSFQICERKEYVHAICLFAHLQVQGKSWDMYARTASSLKLVVACPLMHVSCGPNGRNGLQAQALLLELQAAMLQSDDDGVSESSRASILAALAEADKALVDGADEQLQLLSVVSQTQKALSTAA